MKNDLAFPNMIRQINENTFERISDGGLTKREYFAAQCFLDSPMFDTLEEKVYWAVRAADTLIAELSKEQK